MPPRGPRQPQPPGSSQRVRAVGR